MDAAKAAAKISEEYQTWAEGRDAGYTVPHGSKALSGCELIRGSKSDGAVYRASFFGQSQVHQLTS